MLLLLRDSGTLNDDSQLQATANAKLKIFPKNSCQKIAYPFMNSIADGCDPTLIRS